MLDCSSSTEPEIQLAGLVLARLSADLEGAGTPFLVLGATARNLLSVGLFGRLPERGTHDVDIAIAVPSWEVFERATAGLGRGHGAHTFLDELYADVSVLERFDFDVELAAAYRLGSDVSALLAPHGRAEVRTLLRWDRLARLAGDIRRPDTRSPRRLDALA